MTHPRVFPCQTLTNTVGLGLLRDSSSVVLLIRLDGCFPAPAVLVLIWSVSKRFRASPCLDFMLIRTCFITANSCRITRFMEREMWNKCMKNKQESQKTSLIKHFFMMCSSVFFCPETQLRSWGPSMGQLAISSTSLRVCEVAAGQRGGLGAISRFYLSPLRTWALACRTHARAHTRTQKRTRTLVASQTARLRNSCLWQGTYFIQQTAGWGGDTGLCARANEHPRSGEAAPFYSMSALFFHLWVKMSQCQVQIIKGEVIITFYDNLRAFFYFSSKETECPRGSKLQDIKIKHGLN